MKFHASTACKTSIGLQAIDERLQQESSFAETFLSKIVFFDFSKKKIQLSKLKNGCEIEF